MIVHGIEVGGNAVDAQTRCVHYHSPDDIVAIKFACCGTYYPCYRCHLEAADHPAQTWPRNRFFERAVLCGHCGHEMTIREYLRLDPACPECGAAFNPDCRRHRHRYFQRQAR